MNILICNDDGYQAKGLSVLAQAASKYGAIRVIAPDRNKTAASHSLTLHKPLALKQAENGFYYVNGTPTDCVHLALSLFDDFKPDWIFSGINHGVNLGEDVLYSGTVASATQGYLMGIPSIAFSLNDKTDRYWQTAYSAVDKIVRHLSSLGVRHPLLWNVNIPQVEPQELKGIKVVALGRREQGEGVIPTKNPQGETIYWMALQGKEMDSVTVSDFSLNKEGYVTITPLTADRTAYAQLGKVAAIFDSLVL
ncbi:MAG: 5'/3'-nucleotidase SurE [Neisseriaceae bacterium]